MYCKAARLACGEETEYFNMPERLFGRIGTEQAAYVQKTLAENQDVRWTFLLMHKPAWQKATDTGFDQIEAALGDRQYTIFNGHFHTYAHDVRQGRDYISLGTTSGGQNPQSDMAFDHVHAGNHGRWRTNHRQPPPGWHPRQVRSGSPR